MSKINEMLNKIDELNKQIEDEPKNSSRRKLKIDIQIDELEEEKRHAGFHSDPATVQQCVSKIKMLQAEKSIDYVAKYESEIEYCKKEIVNVIKDYYKKGNDIHEIIKIENIPQSVSNNWLSLSNFGENSGYLFVDFIDGEKHKWNYSNPITEIDFCSSTLDGLKTQIKKNDEVLFIFDNDLANESNNKDLKIYSEIINRKLDNLKDFTFSNAQEVFRYLNINASKFNKEQVIQLCEIMIRNPLLNRYSDDFNHIIDVNKDKLDEKFIDDVYKEIIDKILWRFRSFGNMGDIFSELRGYVDKLSKIQIILLCDSVIKNDDVFYYCDDFEYIFSFIENNFEDINLNGFYRRIINDNIMFLKDIHSDNDDVSEDILYDLSKFADHIDNEQFLNLSDIIIDNVRIHNFAEDFNKIVEVVEKNYPGINFDEIYRDIIDSRIQGLKYGNVSIRKVFGDLGAISHSFTENQFYEFYKIVDEKDLSNYFSENHLNSFLRNKSNYHEAVTHKLYQLMIDYKLTELDNLVFGYPEAKRILGTLGQYASVFTTDQINRLCTISIENSQIYRCFICTENLEYILKKNRWKADDALFEEACMKNEIHIR